MDLAHTFTVPASIEDTWAAFNDIESVAGCFPGATVTSVEGDEFKGSCKVKLGPIALVYNGSGKFLEKNADAHRFVVEAKGKDKRGNGTAGATVTATFSSPTPDSTEVTVVTDLAITGKPAQFGRGVMQDVSDKLLQAFVGCLKTKVGSSGAPEAAEDSGFATSAGGKHLAAESAAGTDSAGESGAARGAGQVEAGGDGLAAPRASGNESTSSETGRTGGAVSGGAGSSRLPVPAPENDALDLGATVLPILIKSYWKQAAGVLLGLIILKHLLGRRHR